eukprot:8802216-Pyramimonas_sp.AAC.1
MLASLRGVRACRGIDGVVLVVRPLGSLGQFARGALSALARPPPAAAVLDWARAVAVGRRGPRRCRAP